MMTPRCLYILKDPGNLRVPLCKGPSGLGLHKSVKATDHDSTFGHICPVPMVTCILGARINDVTVQAIC